MVAEISTTGSPTTFPYRVRRDKYGAQAIERDGCTVLILATGAERNKEEVDALVSALNREAMLRTTSPRHPLVVDSVTKLRRKATQEDIHEFERIAMELDHLKRTLKELIDAG